MSHTDLHFHPTPKPFGNSSKRGTKTGDINGIACTWPADPPDVDDELAEDILGFVAYRESDFSKLVNRKVSVGVVALYPVETAFVHPEIFKPEGKERIEMITLLGEDCISFLRSTSYSYFECLKRKYNYLVSLDGNILFKNANDFIARNY